MAYQLGKEFLRSRTKDTMQYSKSKDNGFKEDPNKLITLFNVNIEVLIMILKIAIMKITIMIAIIIK